MIPQVEPLEARNCPSAVSDAMAAAAFATWAESHRPEPVVTHFFDFPPAARNPGPITLPPAFFPFTFAELPKKE